MATLVRIIRSLGAATLVGGLLFLAGSAVAPAHAGAAVRPPVAAPCYPPGSATCTPPCPTTVTPGSAAAGQTVTVTACGFAAGSTVTINVCNLETLTTTANGSGQISLPVTIPSNAPPGPCAITLGGIGANGQKLTLSTAFTITGGSVVPPTHTGEPWSSWAYWVIAGGMGMLGFLVVALGRRRKANAST